MDPLAGLIVAAALASSESGRPLAVVGHPYRAPARPTQNDRSPDPPESAAPTWINPELGLCPRAAENSQYARNFGKPDAASKLEPGGCAKDPTVRKTYIDAQD